MDWRARRVLACIGFTVITLALLQYAGHVLRPGRSGAVGGAAWQAFYALEEESVDVVFYGSSHAFSGIDPAVIWRERGIPTFVHGGPMQLLGVSEYYMRETLETQKPAVMAVEMTSASYSPRTFNPRFHTINVGRMPWTTNKLAASWWPTPEDLRVDILSDVFMYHARWTEVTERDFDLDAKDEQLAYLKGFVPTMTSQEVTSQPYVRPADDYAISNAALSYNAGAIHRIAAFCAENDIELLLFLTPTGPPEGYTYFLEEPARELSARYENVEVLDLSVLGAVTDISFVEDFRDPGHLNWAGAEKASRVMADYLAETYGLVDRRGEAGYDTWDEDAMMRDAYIEDHGGVVDPGR